MEIHLSAVPRPSFRLPFPLTDNRTKIVAVALAAFILIAAIYLIKRSPLFFLKKMDPGMLATLTKLLDGRTIKSTTELKPGSWLVKTDKGEYVFQQKIPKINPLQFQLFVQTYTEASNLNLSPKFVNSDQDEQAILSEYVKPKELSDQDLAIDAMNFLRTFHHSMRCPEVENADDLFPWKLLSEGRDILLSDSTVPPEFFNALGKARAILEKLAPVVKDHLVLCHGNFFKENIISSESSTLAVGFFSAPGDRFFDLATFYLHFPEQSSNNLLNIYLNRSVTEQDIAHLKLMYLVFTMVIATHDFLRKNPATAKIALEKFTQQTSTVLFEDLMKTPFI